MFRGRLPDFPYRPGFLENLPFDEWFYGNPDPFIPVFDFTGSMVLFIKIIFPDIQGVAEAYLDRLLRPLSLSI